MIAAIAEADQQTRAGDRLVAHRLRPPSKEYSRAAEIYHGFLNLLPQDWAASVSSAAATSRPSTGNVGVAHWPAMAP